MSGGKLITLGDVSIDEVKGENEKAEVHAFNKLKELLKNTSSILYFKPKIFYGLGEANPDILWIHPHVGVVVIEVKAWDFKHLEGCEIVNGGRFVKTKSGKVWKNPIREADEHKNIILNKLKSVCGGETPLPVSYVVMFPNLTHKEYLGLSHVFREHIPEHKCIFKREEKKSVLAKLAQSPSEIFVVKDNDLKKFDFVRKALFPELTIGKESFSITSDDVLIMDIAQERLLRRTHKGRKILRGAPGSGKTVVLVGKAIQEKLYHPHKKILLVTYVRILAEDMRKMIQNIIESRGLELSVDDFEIHTMRSLALELCKKYGISLNDGKEPEDVLIEYLSNNSIPEYDKYDVILCDEVQDFKKEWFRIIFALEKRDSITIFGVDETQRIFEGRDWRWKDVGIEARGRVVHVLRKNYRTTDKVMKLAVEFIKKDATLFKELKELDIDLDGIQSVKTSNDGIKMFIGNEFKIVGNLVRELLSNGYSPGDIFVVNPNSSVLKYYQEELERIVGRDKVHVVNSQSNKDDKRPPTDKILLTTYHSVKGLENRVVIVTGVSTLPRRFSTTAKLQRVDRRTLYVAITRAKERLYITAKDLNGFARDLVELKDYIEIKQNGEYNG